MRLSGGVGPTRHVVAQRVVAFAPTIGPVWGAVALRSGGASRGPLMCELVCEVRCTVRSVR